MSPTWSMGHPMPPDRALCPTCGMGRLPALATPSSAVPPVSAPPPPARDDLMNDGTNLGQAQWSPDGNWWWTGSEWVPAPPTSGSPAVSSPVITGPTRTPTSRSGWSAWRRGPILLLVAGLAAAVATGVVLSLMLGGTDAKDQGALTGAPTSADLALAVDAFQEQRVEAQVYLDGNYLVITVTPIRASASAIDVVDAASRIAWRAVPGNYLGVCVEASNMRRGCKDAAALRALYGEPGGGA